MKKPDEEFNQELEKIIFDIDKVKVKDVFKDVRYTDIGDEEDEQDEEKNVAKYSGKIENLVNKETYDQLPYLGQRALDFLEDVVGNREDLDFEEYLQRYAKMYGEEEIDLFKNTMYRLKSAKVFTIESLKHFTEPMGYKVSLVAEEFKSKDELEQDDKRKNNMNKKYSGNLSFSLLPNMEYNELIEEFIDFLNVLGSEGYTFEMLFGELKKNVPDDRALVSKLKSSIDKIIKKGKLTWKTMDSIMTSLGMKLEVDFVKESIDTEEIPNQLNMDSKINLNEDDITKK